MDNSKKNPKNTQYFYRISLIKSNGVNASKIIKDVKLLNFFLDTFSFCFLKVIIGKQLRKALPLPLEKVTASLSPHVKNKTKRISQ